jgi:hypothetical protein
MLKDLSEHRNLSIRKIPADEVNAPKLNLQMCKARPIALDELGDDVDTDEPTASMTQPRAYIEVTASKVDDVGRLGKLT